MTQSNTEVIVYVVSDAAGDTGELVVRAAIAQFHPINTDIRRAPFVTDEISLQRIAQQAKQADAIVLYTLVIPHLRDCMRKQAETYGVVAIDLLGSFIETLEVGTSMLHPSFARLSFLIQTGRRSVRCSSVLT